MNSVKKNDFLATLVKNPDLSISDLKDNGITPENSSLLDKEEYKAMPDVVKAFSDDNGKFDEKKFDSYYDTARILYSDYATDRLSENIITNLTYGEDAWFAPEDAKFRDSRPVIAISKKPASGSQGIKYITESYFGNETLSVRELAQREKIVDFETGKELDYSPNDKAGLFKRFSLPTLVLAQWDEDGTHLEDGVEVSHKAGDLKYNDNGRPYYETLGNREIYNKDVLHNSDVLTVDGSNWNKFDIWDSDDIKKNAGKIALNLVWDIAPMFIPGVGEVYGYIGAAAGIARVAPVLGKTINNIVGIPFGGANKDVNRALSNWEAYASRYDRSVSDFGREHVVSWEGLGNLVTDISKQLFEQRAISTIPVLLQKAKGAKNVESAINWSRNLPLAYMAATSAQDVYGDFKQAGASDAVAGLGMLASTLALYRLMNIDYFRDNILKDTFMDESEIRAALRGVSKDTASKISTAFKVTTPTEAATFTQKFSNFYHDTLLNGLRKKGIAGLAARGLSEGTEEVMEEVTTDLVKAVTEGLNLLNIPVTEENKSLDFGWSMEDFATRYGMSFAGGFLGGMIFAGQNRYEKWLNTKLNKIPNLTQEDREKLVYFIANGKRGEIDEYLDKWHDKGLLGSKDLSIDGDILTTLDGTSKFVPKTTGISQNDAVYQTIKNELDLLEQAITSEVPDMRYLTKEGLDQLYKLGYNDSELAENPNLITASTIVALKDYSSFETDLYKNLGQIASTKLELQQRIQELSKPTATTQDAKQTQADNIEKDSRVKELREELKKLREEKDKFFKGEKNKYYSGQALFAANESLHNNFINISEENYAKIKYGRSLDSFTDEQKDDIHKEWQNYNNKEGRNQVYRAFDLYLDLSSKYAPIIKEHGEALDKAFDENKKRRPILGEVYRSLLDKKKGLESEKSELQQINIEELTEDQKNRLISLDSELDNLQISINLLNINPQLGNIEAGEISDKFTSNPNVKLSIYDDISLLIHNNKTNNITADINPTFEILQALRSEYQADINNGKYRFDDADLVAFLRSIANSYQSEGGVKQRIDMFTSGIAADEHYTDDEGWPLLDVAQKIENDPNDPLWITGRIAENPSVERIIDNIINNIGINNNIALASYNELLDFLGANTKLLEPGNEFYLNDFLNIVLPTINGESIIDIIKEFDSYRQNPNMHYSAFLDIAESLGTDVKDLNLLKLVQQESMNLANSERLDEYLIRNINIANALGKDKLDPIFKVVRAVVLGSADGTNDIINAFKGGEISELATMSEQAARHILNQGVELAERLEFLRSLSDANSARSLRKHKDTAIKMSPKWIKSILNIAEYVKKTFDDKIDIEQLWRDAYGQLDITTVDNTNYADFEEAVNNFNDSFYAAIHNYYNGDVDSKDLAQKLVSLVNKENLFKTPQTKITDRDDEEITNLGLIYHLATLSSIPSTEFYQAYLDLDENNLAPVPGQIYAIKQTVAQMMNPELFNNILIEIQNSINDTNIQDKKTREYWLNKSILRNFGTILGSAGSGKTVGVITRILNILNNNKDESTVSFVFAAKEDSQANNLKNNAGIDGIVTTIDEYCKTTFGKPISNYKLSDDNDHVYTTDSISTIGSAFDSNAKFKILVIDEIQTLTEAELAFITSDANERGIFVIGMGDLKQPGVNISLGNEKVHSSGIDDCIFVSTPILTTSMRSQTIAKVENTENLSIALDKAISDTQKNPNAGIKERADIIGNEIKNPLYYYEDPKTGELSGDMNVNTDEEFDAKIQSISALDKSTIIIVEDSEVGKYKKYEVPGKVSVIPYSRRAGVEADYVLVNVDLKKYNSRNGEINKFLLAQDFYTLTQRSRLGTVIKTSPEINSVFSFKSDETKSAKVIIDSSQIKDFSDWWKNSLKGITPQKDALKDYFNSSNLVTNTKKEIPTEKQVSEPNIPNQETSIPDSQPGGFTQEVTIPQTPVETIKEPDVTYQQQSIISFTAFDKFFNNELGEISDFKDLYSILVKVFPYVKWENLNIDPNFNISIETFIINNTKLKNDIAESIKEVYGTAGENLLNTILSNPKGFDKQSGEAILHSLRELRPISKKLSRHGNIRSESIIRSGDFTSTSVDVYDLVHSESFKNWALSQPDSIESYKDMTKVIRLNNDRERSDAIDLIGSNIRTGFYQSSLLGNMYNVNVGARMDFNKFSKGDTQLWIVPYTDNKGLLVSRHYHNDGKTYFDVPVLVINNPTLFGQYIGTIDIIKTLKLQKSSDGSRISTTDLQINNPSLKLSKTAGVVAVPIGNTTIRDVNGRTSVYLNSNNGKTFIPTTDETAIYNKYFISNRSIFTTDSITGDSVLGYGKYDFMGVQCSVSLETFLDTLNKYRAIAGLQSRDIDADPRTYFGSRAESKESVSSDVIDNIDLIKSSQNQIRQLLPKDRAGQLMAAAVLSSDNIAFKLGTLLNKDNKNKKYKQSYSLNLEYQFDENTRLSYNIAVVNGQYVVANYNSTTGEYDIDSRIDLEMPYNPKIDLRELTSKLFGKNIVPSISIGFNSFNTKTGFNYSRNNPFVTTNWALSTIFGEITPEEVTSLKQNLKDWLGWEHGIYFDDKTVKGSQAPDSHYLLLDPGNRTYYTDRTTVANYTTYAININPETVLSPTEAPKQSLNSFLSEKRLGITADSIEEANDKLAKRVKNCWEYQKVALDEESGTYYLYPATAQDQIDWIKQIWGVDFSENIDNINDLSTAFDNEDLWSGYLNVLVYKDKYGVMRFINKSNSINSLTNFNDVLDHISLIFNHHENPGVLSNYVASKFFNDVQYNTQELIDLINNNLDLADKIAIFEEDFNC